jgi:hypothetical protein
MVLNVGLESSVGKVYDWKGTREKAGEIKRMKAYLPNGERFPVQFPKAVTAVHRRTAGMCLTTSKINIIT